MRPPRELLHVVRLDGVVHEAGHEHAAALRAEIIDSIQDRLLPLPDETVVHTGHGDDTTIGDEAPHLEEWIARGH